MKYYNFRNIIVQYSISHCIPRTIRNLLFERYLHSNEPTEIHHIDINKLSFKDYYSMSNNTDYILNRCNINKLCLHSPSRLFKCEINNCIINKLSFNDTYHNFKILIDHSTIINYFVINTSCTLSIADYEKYKNIIEKAKIIKIKISQPYHNGGLFVYNRCNEFIFTEESTFISKIQQIIKYFG